MSILRGFFSKNAASSSLRQDFMKVVDDAITNILLINFTMLDWAPFSCSLEGPAGSKKARGYLIGLGEAIINQFQSMNPTQEEIMAAMASAFGFVFGEANATQSWHRMLDTIDGFQVGDVEVKEGAAIAHQDVLRSYAGGHIQAQWAFGRLIDSCKTYNSCKRVLFCNARGVLTISEA